MQARTLVGIQGNNLGVQGLSVVKELMCLVQRGDLCTSLVWVCHAWGKLTPFESSNYSFFPVEGPAERKPAIRQLGIDDSTVKDLKVLQSSI